MNLSKVPESQKSLVLDDVGEFLVTSILRKVSEGKSPVDGFGSFEKLNKKYAKDFKSGDRTPNLELTGDLLDSLEYRASGEELEIGYFDNASEKTLGKADGHNNFSGKSQLPTRRYIPKGDETFISSIQNEIENIVSEYERDEDGNASDISDSIFIAPSVGGTPVALNNLFDDEFLGRLFGTR